MATANIYTLAQWTANDGTQDSLGSLTAPVQVTYSLGQVIDKSLSVPDSTSTQVFDLVTDSSWEWMAMHSDAEDFQVVYVGLNDADSSAFVLAGGSTTVLVSRKTMQYNADDQVRLAKPLDDITKIFVYQTSGVAASLRFVVGR